VPPVYRNTKLHAIPYFNEKKIRKLSNAAKKDRQDSPTEKMGPKEGKEKNQHVYNGEILSVNKGLQKLKEMKGGSWALLVKEKRDEVVSIGKSWLPEGGARWG